MRGASSTSAGGSRSSAAWAGRYDQPGNATFDIDAPEDAPEVRRLVDPLPPGAALDAACGTGRSAQWPAERGHRVIGVIWADSALDMPALAQARVPGGELLLGDPHRLAGTDAHGDLSTGRSDG